MEAHNEPQSVLFVCLGNICRSPLAEGIFEHLIQEEGLEDSFRVDSAGTGAYHAGEGPDPRSIAIAEEHGIPLTSVARQVRAEDFESFDIIVAMDRANVRSLEELRMGRKGKGRLVMMRDFDPEGPGGDVPDPYYGGADGFERVYQMLDRCCRGLLEQIRGG